MPWYLWVLVIWITLGLIMVFPVSLFLKWRFGVILVALMLCSCVYRPPPAYYHPYQYDNSYWGHREPVYYR